MKKISLFLLTLPLCTIGNLTFINTVKAQEVTSDGTVSTTVTSPDRKNFNINDGTTRGTNLFHSFKEFSVPTGGSAVFNNAANIQNIISRVTGGSKSTIDGLIKANGGANLFLLNPAGILFGPNASLNIGGSFLGSTANSFIFSNGFEFSATNPQAPPLLTINLPIGLRYGENPQSITVQGPGHNITSTSTYATIRTDNPGLSVQPEQTLALVGGDVLLEGGNLRAESGRIELGSVRSPSLVNLSATNSGFALDYSAVQNFGDISLSKKASLDTSGQRGGEVQVQGKKLSLRDGSTILSITEGSRTGGNFIINASESVELIGESADGEFNSSFSTEVQGSGSGGDININTRKFTAADGGQLAASTFGKGNAGNVRINAADTVSFAGTSNDGFPSAAFSTVEAGGEGKGGEINITAGSLELINGGQLNTFVRGASETTP
ncbi:MAG: filamentous hemagglutinin N-terminal domain-containing protein, partial [Brasilonema sp.]